jgi:transcription-repair coupling factor (superfamily II helicase)
LKALIFVILLLPGFLSAQPVESDEVYVPAEYQDSPDAPIKIPAGLIMRSAIDGYFINEKRYVFYRKLHEFATDAEFKGHEKEILDGFGGFLTESDAILKEMSDNTGKLESAAEDLKKAQEAVNQLNAQVDELRRQNEQLNERLNKPIKQKKKWGVPLFVGISLGLVGGILLN